MLPDTIRSGPCGRTFLSAASLLFLLGNSGFAAEPAVNPTARLRIARTTTLWKSDDGKVSAHRARFSPDGKTLAFITTDGQLVAADVDSAKTRSVWQSDGGSIVEPIWSPTGDLAACVAIRDGDKVTRTAILSAKGTGAAKPIPGTDGAENLTWRPDAKAIAFSTQSALLHLDLATGKTLKLADERKGWRPKGAPAYENLTFIGEHVAGRAAGTMSWSLASRDQNLVSAEPGAGIANIGQCRGVIPASNPEGLYCVPWVPGPARISRGSGIVLAHCAGTVALLIVPYQSREEIGDGLIQNPAVDLDAVPAGSYWLVDISDCEYPTTLRLSQDGKSLTFLGVKCGGLSKNPWRELCLWQVPADGSKPPVALVELGPQFKRVDVGREYAIGWRIIKDPACILVDFTRGKGWRLPKEFEVQRTNTDVLLDKLLVGAARGSDVVLIQLEEEKDK